MRLGPVTVPLPAVMWFGLLGPAFAFVLEFVFGFGITQAACSPGGAGWGIPLQTWAAIATGVAAFVAVLGIAAATLLFLRTRQAPDAPPAGRIHFLSVVSLATGPLFLFIILMGGLGASVLDVCHQG